MRFFCSSFGVKNAFKTGCRGRQPLTAHVAKRCISALFTRQRALTLLTLRYNYYHIFVATLENIVINNWTPKKRDFRKRRTTGKGRFVAEDRLKKIDEQISKLKAQKQALLNRDRAKDRKLRTRRLIQIGAIFEKCLEIGSVEEAEVFARIAAEDPGRLEELKSMVKAGCNRETAGKDALKT